MKEKLLQVKEELFAANSADVTAAHRNAGLDAPIVKHLTITDKVFDYIHVEST